MLAYLRPNTNQVQNICRLVSVNYSCRYAFELCTEIAGLARTGELYTTSWRREPPLHAIPVAATLADDTRVKSIRVARLYESFSPAAAHEGEMIQSFAYGELSRVLQYIGTEFVLNNIDQRKGNDAILYSLLKYYTKSCQDYQVIQMYLKPCI